MAAITGLPMFSTRSNTCWPARACSRPLVGVCTASSLMSAPATNDLSPAPVRMTTRTLSSCFRSRRTRRSSSSVCVFSALSTFGRLIVTMATALSRSNRRLSKAMANLDRERIHHPAEHDGRCEEAREQQPPEAELVPGFVFGDDREDERHEKRKQREQQQMTPHHFRPSATS